jgi:hypothetical protein
MWYQQLIIIICNRFILRLLFYLFVNCLAMLWAAQNVKLRMIWWERIMNCKWRADIRHGSTGYTVLAFYWRYWGNPWEISQNIRCPERDSKLPSAEFKSETLSLHPTWSMLRITWCAECKRLYLWFQTRLHVYILGFTLLCTNLAFPLRSEFCGSFIYSERSYSTRHNHDLSWIAACCLQPVCLCTRHKYIFILNS